MRTSASVVVPGPPDVVFPHVADLAGYPAWMGLVHSSAVVPDADPPAWVVEIRARVGPFARSKVLRMERTRHEPDRAAAFERREVDGRRHARWALDVELLASGDSTEVTMRLAYDGALWTGGLLERALDEEIRRGRAGLIRLVSDAPRR